MVRNIKPKSKEETHQVKAQQAETCRETPAFCLPDGKEAPYTTGFTVQGGAYPLGGQSSSLIANEDVAKMSGTSAYWNLGEQRINGGYTNSPSESAVAVAFETSELRNQVSTPKTGQKCELSQESERTGEDTTNSV